MLCLVGWISQNQLSTNIECMLNVNFCYDALLVSSQIFQVVNKNKCIIIYWYFLDYSISMLLHLMADWVFLRCSLKWTEWSCCMYVCRPLTLPQSFNMKQCRNSITPENIGCFVFASVFISVNAFCLCLYFTVPSVSGESGKELSNRKLFICPAGFKLQIFDIRR